MKQTFDLDAIVYGLLNVPPITGFITGGVYVGDDRPDDSACEDIVVNCIDLSQDYLPQVGTSNVNVYVPDKPRLIGGKQQFKACRQRMRSITEKVVSELRKAVVPGLILTIDAQTVLNESEIRQHYVNIRISWNIQTE